jgi:hypothetical protein
MNSVIPITTWSRHNCAKSHRNAATFLECCLNKYYHNGENAHKPSIRLHGEGEWAVIKESWSDVYYTEHSGRRNNQTHKIFEVALLPTYEVACSFYEKVSSACWDDNCRGGRCVELREQIVKISK